MAAKYRCNCFSELALMQQWWGEAANNVGPRRGKHFL